MAWRHWCSLILLIGPLPAAIAGQATSPKPAEPEIQLPDALQFIVFANRRSYNDGHWYANFGYYCDDAKPAYAGNGQPAGGRLSRLDVRSGEVKVLVDAKAGSIRDPSVHYDAQKVLFSWRKEGTDDYHLYEIGVDGEGLRQLTAGPFSDIEATYLPDGNIVFVSSRCMRWVNCWKTHVGTLYRCRADGSGIQPISANVEHDNTPAVLPDGRVLFTRWEYVDRSQMGYHHLWVMNPDGTGQMAFYGNQRHYPLYIDAQPVPGSRRIVCIDSPGHGRTNHCGWISVIDPALGPDAPEGIRRVAGPKDKPEDKDPFPLSDDLFLLANGKQIQAIDARGRRRVLHTSDQDCHEPRPVLARTREPVLPDRTDLQQTTGRLLLSDLYVGRNMEGVKRGEVRMLLVLESLPKPVNFSGGMDLLSWFGTFTLERVLGTVPVEPDGSAYFEVPANRAVFFVALDERDLSIKRMQSFVSVMPGETTGCVGCHEPRSHAPGARHGTVPLAALREPSRIQPFSGFPDVLDFQRDVQPVLNRNCMRCHSAEKHEGSVVLEEGLGPAYFASYHTLLMRLQVADGRNGFGNQPPRTIGSSASRLMKKLDGSHHEVKVSEQDWRTIWLWIESGAPNAGTYAALRNEAEMALQTAATAETLGQIRPVLAKRCASCHGVKDLPPLLQHYEMGDPRGIRRPLAVYERRVIENDPLARFSTYALVNFTRPERSRILLAPLAKPSGGWGACGEVFRDRQDPDFVRLLGALEQGAKKGNSIARFGTPGFRPNAQYIREMVRYGVLSGDQGAGREELDPFVLDQAYWRLFWWKPVED